MQRTIRSSVTTERQREAGSRGDSGQGAIPPFTASNNEGKSVQRSSSNFLQILVYISKHVYKVIKIQCFRNSQESFRLYSVYWCLSFPTKTRLSKFAKHHGIGNPTSPLSNKVKGRTTSRGLPAIYFRWIQPINCLSNPFDGQWRASVSIVVAWLRTQWQYILVYCGYLLPFTGLGFPFSSWPSSEQFLSAEDCIVATTSSTLSL